MELNEWKTDSALSKEGAWVPLEDGGRIKVARAGNMNPHYTAAMQIHWGEHFAKTFADEIAKQRDREETLRKIALSSLLKEWDGFTEGGDPLPFTEENAKRVLSEIPELVDVIFTAANQRALFVQQAQESKVGKSTASSNGQPAGQQKPSGSRA